LHTNSYDVFDRANGGRFHENEGRFHDFCTNFWTNSLPIRVGVFGGWAPKYWRLIFFIFFGGMTAVVLPPMGELAPMKNENVDKRTVCKLDELTEEQKSFVLEMAANARMIDVVEALKEHGVLVSVATVSRYLQRDREKRLLEDGGEMKEAVAALAERGKDGTLRKGSLEAARQRLYERVLTSNDPEEALALYNSMLKEEVKLQELALEERRVKVAEGQLRVQRLRLRKDETHKAMVECSDAVVEAMVVNEARLSERELKLVELVWDLSGILNRGGGAEEKVMDARSRLGDGVKLLEECGEKRRELGLKG
jgi:hypothetical protein